MDQRLRVKELLNIICSMVHYAIWYSCYNEGSPALCLYMEQAYFIYMLILGFNILILCTLKKKAKYFVHGQICLTRRAWILFKALKWISSQSVLHKLSIREAYFIPRLHHSEITSLLLLLMDLSQSGRHITFDTNEMDRRSIPHRLAFIQVK